MSRHTRYFLDTSTGLFIVAFTLIGFTLAVILLNIFLLPHPPGPPRGPGGKAAPGAYR